MQHHINPLGLFVLVASIIHLLVIFSQFRRWRTESNEPLYLPDGERIMVWGELSYIITYFLYILL